jgi:hypothetical protein
MPATRRRLLQAAALAGFAGGASPTQAQASGAGQTSPARPATPVSEVQVPKVMFGNAEISRLVVGCNQFYGFAHFNRILSTVMKEYYTSERICEVLHQCNRFGINAHNWVDVPRARQDLERFQAEGGRMHLIVQGVGDPAEVCRTLKPLAIYHQGDRTDAAYHKGSLEPVKEWCKKARQTGVKVGVGSHNPEVLAQVENEGWDVDFYAGCVYYRSRSVDEWKKVLGGELLDEGDIYLRSDPPRMYKFMRQTRKPCFAFKILAAGRIDDRSVDQAFRTAFESIKPSDCVFVGMFPRVKDEVRENAECVHRILTSAAA